MALLSGLAVAQDAKKTSPPAEAMARWKAARSEAETAGDSRRMAECDFRLGDLLREQRQFDAARAHLECALTTLQQLHDAEGQDDDGMGAVLCLDRLGQCFQELGNHELARQKFERAVELVQRLIDGDDDRIVTLLYKIGIAHVRLERSDLALPRHQSALAMSQRLHGEAHPSVAVGLDHVGTCLMVLGRHAEALPLLERALTMSRQLYTSDHHAIAACLMHRAQCFEGLGRYDEALQDHAAAVAAMERVYGEDHEVVAKVVAGLGSCLASLGRYDEALRQLERALAMTTRLHEGDHSSTAYLLHNIARSLRELGQHEPALAKYESALAMAKRVHEPSHPFVALSLRALGNHLRLMGRVVEGLPKVDASLVMLRRLYAGDHPEIATGLTYLAVGLRAIGRGAEALAAMEAAVDMRRRLTSGDSLVLSTELAGLAECLVSVGRFHEALSVAEASLAMLRRLFPDGHPDLADRLTTVANCQARLRDPRALATAEEALATCRRARQGDDPDVALCLVNTAFLLHSHGRSREAIPPAEAGLAMLKRLDPSGIQPRMAGALSLLALLRLETEGDPAAGVRLLDEAIVEIESLRHLARSLPAEDRTAYFSNLKLRTDAYGRMRRAQVRLGSAGLALAYAERARGRSMLDFLAAGQLDALAEAERRADARGDLQEVARVRAARSDLAAADTRLGHIHHEMAQLAADRTLAADARTAQKARLDAEARAANERRVRAMRERARVVADVEAIGEPATPESLQASLEAGELLLLWALDAKDSHLFLVPPTGGIEVVAIGATYASAERAVERLRFQMSSAQERRMLTESGREPPAVDARAFARSVLPDEVWRRCVRTARRVFAVPDGALHRLPLETLLLAGRDDDPRPWIEDGPPIAYAASGSVLAWLRARERSRPNKASHLDLVAVGDPVFPGADADRLPDCGALVDRVGAGSAAERVGLLRGDVLLAYGGHALADAAALPAAIAEVESALSRSVPPATVPLRVLRQGKEIAVAVAPGPLGVQLGRGTARAAWHSGYAQSVDEQMAASQVNLRLGPFANLARLPDTRSEVEAIAAALRDADAPERVRLLLGADATEANVFALAGQARYLHFATHGLAHESEAVSLSALALSSPAAASEIDDGFLKLTDLLTRWGQHLPACRMVVLSACRTHVGPQFRDEAPHALPVGFLYAGASSVVATQWMVPDKTTARLMADFFSRIRAQGDRPDRLAALTDAKRELRREHPSPYFWAPFVYVGTPR